jgi:SAM-dependent methyltransferase
MHTTEQSGDSCPHTPPLPGGDEPSPWVVRWSHLVPAGGRVLDVACGGGRHSRWFHARQHPITAVDVAPAAIDASGTFGEALCADIENAPWPLAGRQFGAVVVTNYLWRPLLPTLVDSLAPGGVLIYETFAAGNETVGSPRAPTSCCNPANCWPPAPVCAPWPTKTAFLNSPERVSCNALPQCVWPRGADARTPSRARALVRMPFSRLKLRT